MMLEDASYLFQIAFYLMCLPVSIACIYMIWRCRIVLRGLARGLITLLSVMIALFILLGVRCLHDMLGFMSIDALLLLSNLIAIMKFSALTMFAIDMYYVYRNLPIYMMSINNLKKREDNLEAMRAQSERIGSMWSN